MCSLRDCAGAGAGDGVIIGRHFQDGSEVKKGDLLFTIDPRPFQAVLDQAKGASRVR
jgi:multidrug resistance efflux pump